MARSKVKLNHPGVRKVLDEVADAECKPRAEAGAARARASAKVATGAYRDSIHVWASVNPSRKVWRYGSNLPYASVIEADTGNLARSA